MYQGPSSATRAGNRHRLPGLRALSVNEVVGFDVGDGGVIRLPHRLQRVPAEDRGGGAAGASVASVGVVP